MMAKLYIAGDDVWKIYNWKVELDKLTNAFTKHPDKAIPITFTDNLLFLKSLGDDVLENTGTLTRFEGGISKNKLNQALRRLFIIGFLLLILFGLLLFLFLFFFCFLFIWIGELIKLFWLFIF